MNGKPMWRRMVLLPLLLIALPASAQRHSYRALLRPISRDGFYKVIITPEITARTTTDMRDLRITDVAGTEVPYLCGDNMIAGERKLHPFAIISNSKSADGRTHIIVRNDVTWPINELFVPVRNTAARRSASVSGSKDGKTFFSLRDSVILDATPGTMRDTVNCILQIPQTTYPFLQITIFDKDLLPLDVLGAGVYKDSLIALKYVEVPHPAFRQIDSSDYKSYIYLYFKAPYRVEHLTFIFDGPRFYKRLVTLYSDGIEAGSSIADQSTPAVVRTRLNTMHATLVIANENNPPIRLHSVIVKQQEQYLLAYLESGTGYEGRGYKLTFGDSTLPAPVYDLRYFKDSINRTSLPEILPDSIEQVQVTSAQPVKIHKPLLGKGAMWAIIIAVLIGLIAATGGLMRQMKKNT